MKSLDKTGMGLLGTRAAYEKFSREEFEEMKEEMLKTMRQKDAEFCFSVDVLLIFARDDREWAAMVALDKDKNPYLLFCAREELVDVLDEVRPRWREQMTHPDFTKLN